MCQNKLCVYVELVENNKVQVIKHYKTGINNKLVVFFVEITSQEYKQRDFVSGEDLIYI